MLYTAHVLRKRKARKYVAGEPITDPEAWGRKQATEIRSRCRRNGYECDVDAEYLSSILEVSCGVCGCGLRSGGVKDKRAASIDRVYPARGYVRGNLVVICYRCNIRKGAFNPDAMKAYLSFLRMRGMPNG